MKKILFFFILLMSQYGFAQSDCVSAIPLCGNSAISYTPSGPGNVSETLGGCLVSNEHYTVWYSFTVGTAGTLTMLITPNAQADYDWAIYGPNTACGALGAPIRCSYAGTGSGILTGMNLTATDLSEGAGGDGFVRYLDVLPGETYYMVVDNFSQNTNGFQLTWGGTATLASPFNDPTVQPYPFIQPGPFQDGNVLICLDPTQFDFSTLTAGIVNGNPNFHVNYYHSTNDALSNSNPITTPIIVNTTTTYYYAIYYVNPTNPNDPINRCREYGDITFSSGAITVNNPTILSCNINNTGIGTFDLTSSPVFNDPTATIEYYAHMADLAAGTNQITNLTNYTTPATQVFALVTTALGCTNIATITLDLSPALPLVEQTLISCNNNNSGVATFDLTSADVYPADPNAPKIYYPSINDLVQGTNAILYPTQYTSAEGYVYVEVEGALGCKNYVKIYLTFYPVMEVYEDTLNECYTPGTPNVAVFDLTEADVTAMMPNTRKYYPSMQDALNGTNMIIDPDAYSTSNTTVYARVMDANNCWSIAAIHLEVTPPAYSSVLLDKIICLEERTVLDAGPGFQSYQWSTGATTQSISNVSVGEYWVDLMTDGCVTRQTVRVYAAPSPVVTKIDISNNTVTLMVTGGTAPYQFSLDGINWQDSNVLTNVPRGQATVYIKDAYECVPVALLITVPNLINVITPNDDGVNDYMDYSALSFKDNLKISIFDRYGTTIHVADKKNNYRWDGRTGADKLSTGNYWYTISWTEPETKIPVQYSGWIMVKNR
ncbi:T9SS type B sorting domain-containing protein [Chryseobacterium sp. MFBS3-17]|uniref:T9SS type B sorting domain-containing protein n=1 Tax=Chryseobacterium sp. MFBS3-17 TaxID=2886689 RepID=UPI001D0E3D8A|nr:T9SS type B sorting domain-containing protein [Chryseobacterium sp. MFBS3-17]MCC2589399.1 gliding motility-associated C-terminal domain-containing protein [Chryseobacterium sp. MFBS3-17]